MAEPVSVEEALEHLGIDYADDIIKRNVTRGIQAADAYLKGAIGDDYPENDPRVKALALMIVSDYYDNRTMSAAAASNSRKLFNDMCLQLRMELRREHDI